ncbi:hypothetical protein Misp05_44800 [Micromonospora sp. NBRC 107095]|nr:hypothetical protein Misp05_44800 [Micromonospora sp. NBRC 107095]
MSAVDYLRQASPRTLVWTVPTRASMQALFFVLLAGYATGSSGRYYAFLGSVAFAPTMALIARAPDLIGDEVWQGTMHRLRLTRRPIAVIMLARSWIYLVEGVAAALVVLCVVGPSTVGFSRTLSVLVASPIVIVTAFSCLCLGLFIGAAAPRRRLDLLLANGATYLLLLTSGAVIPPSSIPLIDRLGSILPLRHGIAAMRGVVAGALPVDALLREMLVAAGWLTAMWVMLVMHTRRAASNGNAESV